MSEDAIRALIMIKELQVDDLIQEIEMLHIMIESGEALRAG